MNPLFLSRKMFTSLSHLKNVFLDKQFQVGIFAFSFCIALTTGFYFCFQKIAYLNLMFLFKARCLLFLGAFKMWVCRNFIIMSLIVVSFLICSTSLMHFISLGKKSQLLFFQISLLHN